ncbi:MAG: hypothetical protein O2V44_00275 [Candidatus Bathyarchaeota archaeon]|nr:hypothetical protein [Candidatus Bathyarchaeota archaeon]
MKLEYLKNKLIVVAGGGYFGTKALMFGKDVHARVGVIDNRIDCEASRFVDEIIKEEDIRRVIDIEPGSSTLFISDAVDFLVRLLEVRTPDFIFPAMPGNLAGKLIKRQLECEGLVVKSKSKVTKKVMKDIPKSLISLYDENMGVIITSYMFKGSMCRVPCDQPMDFCPTTGRLKMGPMHQILAYATHDEVTLSKILVSRVFGESVGSFEGPELASFLSDVKRLKAPYTLAIGTACDCHGILNLFSIHATQ